MNIAVKMFIKPALKAKSLALTLTTRPVGNKDGQNRFAAAADPIEHTSEEKFLFQIFANMETL